MHHFAFQNAAAMKLLLVGALKDEPSKPFVAKFFEIFFLVAVAIVNWYY